MSTPEHMPMAAFITDYLGNLEPGEVAFHGQLFPNVYPPDRAVHEQIKNGRLPELSGLYCDVIRQKTSQDVHVQRLRALPANHNDNIPAMVAAAALTQEIGEEVRLCRFNNRLLGKLAAEGIGLEWRMELMQPVPRKGFWSVRKHELDDASIVGLMDYGQDAVMHGIDVYTGSDISGELQSYTGFWHNQFLESVMSADWQDLYK